MSGLIALDEARERLLALIEPIEWEVVPLDRAAGRILALPVLAAWSQPARDLSAMDGYAVRSADLGEDNTRLSLAGESAAGHAYEGELPAGHAIRISTGAAVPDGADQIVIQENTRREGDDMLIEDSPREGANIRRAGQDFITDETLGEPGLRLRGENLALLAAGGASELPVIRQPRVGVIASGDELVPAGQWPGPNQIVNSVAPGLMGLIRHWGGEAIDLGIARDNPDSVGEALGRGSNCDLIVTIGGASVGDHDHFRRVFADRDGQFSFEKIAVKPGKPTWSGRLGKQVYLGLPGNPVSALVMARLLLKPALARMLGQETTTVFHPARTRAPLDANGPRETFVRARHLGDGEVEPMAKQDSSVVTALARATCLIRREIGAEAVPAGSAVEILLLD